MTSAARNNISGLMIEVRYGETRRKQHLTPKTSVIPDSPGPAPVRATGFGKPRSHFIGRDSQFMDQSVMSRLRRDEMISNSIEKRTKRA